MFVVIEYISGPFGDVTLQHTLSKVFGPYSEEQAMAFINDPANAGRDIEVRRHWRMSHKRLDNPPAGVLY